MLLGRQFVPSRHWDVRLLGPFGLFAWSKLHKYELGVSLLDPWALWTLLGLVGLKKPPFCGLDGSLATPLGPHVDPMGAPLRQFWCLQRPLGGPRGSPEVPRLKPAIARLSTCRAEGCVLCFRT